MNPDAHMPLYGNDLFAAIEGYDDSIGLGYLRAIWHYWRETHTEGLPDEDEYLRKVCRIDRSDWPKCKPVIFGKWFKLDSKGWQNKRAKEEWSKATTTYKLKCQQTEAARRTLAVKRSVTDSVTTVTGAVTDNVTVLQSESESESEQEACKTNKGGCPPTLTQVKAKASMVNILPEVAEQFWHHFEGSGWIDKNGNPVVKWESKLMTWKCDLQARPLEQAHKSVNGNGAPNHIQLNQELLRILPQITQIENGAASDAMGQKFFTDKDLKRLKEMRTRRDEIRKIIGAKY